MTYVLGGGVLFHAVATARARRLVGITDRREDESLKV